MKPRFAAAFLAAWALFSPILPVGAQSPYSPASPPNTSNPFAGALAPSVAPRQPQVQAALPVTGLAAVPGGFTAATQVMTSEPIDPNHKLGRGDVLSYRVAEDRDNVDTPVYVTDSGEVNVPLIGRVKAAGKTPDQLRADIKSQLEKEYYYHATVIMGLNNVAPRTGRGKVFVIGAVRQVGPVELPLDAPMTASQAIYQMGGPVDFSVLRKTKVYRKGGPKDGIPVNVSAVEKGELDKDVVLEPGDTIKVPTASIGLKF